MGTERHLTKKVRLMLEAYKGKACLNLTEAARLAGYRSPEKQGWEVKERFPALFAEAEEEYRAGLKVSDEELDEAIANLVRTPNHRDHFKALELVARLKGRLDPKVTVQLERKELSSQLDELIAIMISTRSVQIEQPVDIPLLPKVES